MKKEDAEKVSFAVILSEAKNLKRWLRVNSAKNLWFNVISQLRDSSSLTAPQNDTFMGFSAT
jgi:hypothetical protein